ncbi:MmgE/PrpD family protein [Thalassobaculum sp. OXR-137]|uniref:MmgE/PrpD family protein n=1 Tax=Thalassobaculum sp. OXR-137 TaxID=3100173 RepID=UPI002AC89B4D|nr:MmgE/PrpD family protein [Thalassobaculum sp. OXR-137]WPZ32896.1 MmgE/PrpD family protein [Thalassobaculum sp. OXR-137]
MPEDVRDAIERFADHVISTPFEAIPAAAITAAKTYLLDSLGVGVAGTRASYVDAWIDGYQGAVPGAGGRIWGLGGTLPTPAAAAVNGFLIHNSEYDCVHEGAVLHPMATLLSALMAEVEARGVAGHATDGKALLRAIVLGVDVSTSIGNAVTTGLKFFRPATAGGFGATAAIGAIAGLDRESLLDAFGLYYAQAGGTMQAHTEGLALLAMQAGFCARNAVVAVRMAEQGIPGTRGTLEGPYGYLRLMEDAYDREALLGGLGTVWRITEVAHKPFPSGRATHGLLDGLSSLLAEHSFSVDAVERVEASVPPLTHRLIGRPVKEGMQANYARLSGPYTAARMLLTGTLDLTDFTDEALADPATLDLGARVSVQADGNPDPNAFSPVTVTIVLKDGRRLERAVDVVYGSPAKPMSREAHLAKFRANIAHGRGGLPAQNAERLIALVDDLETVADTRGLIDLLVSA